MNVVYPPGAKVKIADDAIAGFINCVALYAHGGILYEIVWWSDGIRNSAWLHESEFSSQEEKSQIGFKIS